MTNDRRNTGRCLIDAEPSSIVRMTAVEHTLRHCNPLYVPTTSSTEESKENQSVPKISISDTMKLFFKLQSAFWQFQTTAVSGCCLINCFRIFYLKMYLYLALEMASPGNQHRANCIGTLSFPIGKRSPTNLHSSLFFYCSIKYDPVFL